MSIIIYLEVVATILQQSHKNEIQSVKGMNRNEKANHSCVHSNQRGPDGRECRLAAVAAHALRVTCEPFLRDSPDMLRALARWLRNRLSYRNSHFCMGEKGIWGLLYLFNSFLISNSSCLSVFTVSFSSAAR